VDDFLSGASDIEEVDRIRTELCNLLESAGMTLRKWRLSSKAFIDTIPSHLVETENLLISPSDKSIKALGIHWNVSQDCFSIATPTITEHQTMTKRTIASNLGKVYDVLGFFSPTIILGKIVLRQLWQLHLGWDDTPPTPIVESWRQWLSQLYEINKFQIPRKYSNNTNIIKRSLHGFSDAPQEAYGAVIYQQMTYSDGTATTAIVISKARVVPLKELTIPRAELTAAYTMAKLLKYCSSILNIQDLNAWTDSLIVLCWLHKSTNSLKTFVSNRVHQINTLIPQAQWRYILSASNPADLLSRGVPANALIKTELWWEGPPWLTLPQQEWPKPQFKLPSSLPEIKAVVLTAPASTDEKPWERYSDFNHALRITSWCRRFFKNCTLAIENRNLTSQLQTE